MHLLKRVDFNAMVDHLALMHIIKSKVQLVTTRIKRLLEVLSPYSFNLCSIKGEDMILSDFLSRWKDDNNNPYEIIPISFNMQSILQSRCNNLGKGSPVKYLVQTQSEAKSRGIKLPEVHYIGKALDQNVQPEKQVIKPITNTKMKEVSQIKPRLGQGMARFKT